MKMRYIVCVLSLINNSAFYTIQAATAQEKLEEDDFAFEVNTDDTEGLLEENNFNEQNNDQNFTPLMRAAQNGSVVKITELLKSGVDPDIQDENGNTALLHALKNGDLEAVRTLLFQEDGITTANPNIPDNVRTTPLMHAAFRGYTPIIELLMEKNADITVKDNFGYTALYYAREARNAGIIAIFSEKNSVQKENNERN